MNWSRVMVLKCSLPLIQLLWREKQKKGRGQFCIACQWKRQLEGFHCFSLSKLNYFELELLVSWHVSKFWKKCNTNQPDIQGAVSFRHSWLTLRRLHCSLWASKGSDLRLNPANPIREEIHTPSPTSHQPTTPYSPPPLLLHIQAAEQRGEGEP